VTSDQRRARSLIATYEGTRLTCEKVDRDYVLTSELGQTYRVDEHAERILVSGQRPPINLTDLEEWIDDRIFGVRGDCDPPDDSLYAELDAIESDLDEERRRDLAAENKRVRDDIEFYARREAA